MNLCFGKLTVLVAANAVSTPFMVEGTLRAAERPLVSFGIVGGLLLSFRRLRATLAAPNEESRSDTDIN